MGQDLAAIIKPALSAGGHAGDERGHGQRGRAIRGNRRTTSVVSSTVDPAFNALRFGYSGTFTPNGTGSAPDFAHSDTALCYLPANNSALGDVLEGFVGFEIDAGLTGVTSPQITVRDGGNTD